MLYKRRWSYRMALTAAIYLFLNTPAVDATAYKILVVMSYEEDNPWCIQIKAGVDSVFAGNSELKYVYMDTKEDFEGGVGKAKEAYEVYKRFRPDGVIAADDSAQSMFVLPYLTELVKTSEHNQ